MALFRQKKIVQIFSDGSLNFYIENINTIKQNLYIFQEKDFKNFELYKKQKKKLQSRNTVQNSYYRKKYLTI